MFLGSVIYKQNHRMVYNDFPFPESLKKNSADAPLLYLFLFFKKSDCPSCLVEMVEVLNSLPSQFCPAGIPVGEEDEQLRDEQELRRLTNISFPLYSSKEFKRYLPWRTPTLFGITPAGKILFVLPGIPGHTFNLENMLISIYGKLYPSHGSGRENIGGV